MLFCLLFFCCSCEKECPVCDTDSDNPSVVTPDLDVTGQWQRVSPYIGEDEYEYITFYRNYYHVESHCEKPHLLFLDGCYGNYTIRDGYFYSWHATDQPNFVVMPYIDGIDYRGRISIENDTLKLSVRFGFAPENVGIGWYVRK